MDNTLKNIYDAALKFLVPLTPEKTYATVVAEAIKLVDGKDGSIFIEQNGKLPRVYTTNKKLYKVIPRKKGYTIKTFKTGKPYLRQSKDLQAVHPAFKKIPVGSDITFALSYEGKSIGVLSILSKKDKEFTRQELHLLYLFAPLATLAIRKTQLYDQTKKALDTRDLFISMASHELKTPLTTISLYAQLIRDKIENGKKPDAKWVDTLSWEVLRLTLLVNELLRIDQIKTGQLQYNFKSCSLKEIINRALTDFQHTHPKRTVALVDNLKPKKDMTHADYDKLLQVIYNLLNNAAKFSSVASPITVVLSGKNGKVTFVIKDGGKGIPKEDLPHIFDRFYKGHDHAREGMGLGLYLSKKIIDEHNGTIDVDSKIDKGTAMTITLPVLSSKQRKH